MRVAHRHGRQPVEVRSLRARRCWARVIPTPSRSSGRRCCATISRHGCAAARTIRCAGLYPVHEGFGRTDALGRIGNTAFGDHLSASNYQIGDAPVSYPYLWNIWKFDWVQYNGSVAQPLARNVGEALGVGAIAPLICDTAEPLLPTGALPQFGGHRRSWSHRARAAAAAPAALAGGNPRRHRSRQGRARQALFMRRCQECHGPHVAEPARQQASAPLKPSERYRVAHRSDSARAHRHRSRRRPRGFIERRYDLSATGLPSQ